MNELEIRETIAEEIAPVIRDCEEMLATLDASGESAIVRMKRIRVELLLAECHSAADRAVRLARERKLLPSTVSPFRS